MATKVFDIQPTQSAASIEPFIRLAAAVLLQAVEDARQGNPEALEWLTCSEVLPIFCEPFEIEPDAVRTWARGKFREND